MSVEAETELFVEYFNEICSEIPDCKSYLPLDSDNIFEKLADGVICARVISKVEKAALPGRVIKSPATTDEDKKANHDSTLKALRENLKVSVEADSEDLCHGEGIDMHEYIWEVLRAHLTRNINLVDRIALIRSLKKGEGLDILFELSVEGVLLRWANYHLQRAGVEDLVVKRFSADFKDVDVWVTILKQVCGDQISGLDSVMQGDSLEDRAQTFLKTISAVSLNKYATVESITNNYWRVNLAFTANIFNNFIGMILPTEEEMDLIMQEFRTLTAKLAECENACQLLSKKVDVLTKELAVATSIQHAEELSLTILQQLESIEDLRATLKELEEKKAALSELVGKNNADVQDISERLIAASNTVNDKSRAVAEHVDKIKALVNESGKHLNPVCTFNLKTEVGSEAADKAALESALDAQRELLEKYLTEITEIETNFTRHKSDARKRMEEINSLVAEYLGSGQSDPGDAIANMKRLLELMIEKCKKQATQIAIFDATIAKMDDLNALVSDKIKSYADSNIDDKKNKKKK